MTGPLLGLQLRGLIKEDVSASNAGIVTLLAADTTIVDVVLSVDVVGGDRVACEAVVLYAKGATAGTTELSLVQGGGLAGGSWVDTRSLVRDRRDTGVTQTLEAILSATFLVTGSGSLTLRLRGNSAGSNATIQAAGGQLRCTTSRGPTV
jgi:hypothetical protein